MASVTMSLLHLLLLVSAASAWSRSSSRYMGYYRFLGGSMTFAPKGSGGKYTVSQRARGKLEQVSLRAAG